MIWVTAERWWQRAWFSVFVWEYHLHVLMGFQIIDEKVEICTEQAGCRGTCELPRFPQSQISTWLLPPTPLQVKQETAMSGWACFQGVCSFSAGSLVFSVIPGTSEPFCTHLWNEWMLNELPSLTEVQEKVHQLNMTGEGSSHISAPVGLGILALHKFA